MEKQPFTPTGVSALQNWLNLLPTLQFNEEILAMKMDFEVWSLAHLELDVQQLSFYDKLSITAKNDLATAVILAASYKRPVTLVQSARRGEGEPVEDKLFKPKSTLTVTSHTDGTYEVEGDLVVEVEYV